MLLDADGEDRYRRVVLLDRIEHAMVADSQLPGSQWIGTQPLSAPALRVRVGRQVDSDCLDDDALISARNCTRSAAAFGVKSIENCTDQAPDRKRGPADSTPSS